MKSAFRLSLVSACALPLLAACASAPAASNRAHDLAGAWKSRVQFESGPFAEVKDLEFLYVFNAGGTLTESSNYDGAPPVPPAYGEWRALAPDRFEARYAFFLTKPPARVDDLASGGGWLPAGTGILTERFTLSSDGQTFESTLVYEAFDAAGNTVPGGGRATGRGARLDVSAPAPR
jgi:hypothetical protein